MPDDASAEPLERGTAKRRATLVLSILKGETSVAEAARRHGLTVVESKTGETAFCWAQRTRSAAGPRMRRRRVAVQVLSIMLFNFTAPFSGKMRTLKKSP